MFGPTVDADDSAMTCSNMRGRRGRVRVADEPEPEGLARGFGEREIDLEGRTVRGVAVLRRHHG